ncbi:MAG: Ldh family oxidoreductase [Pirellulales bacterium]|nr:Ldh family oxidoreductase [Pirellulales bacterium]
MPTFSTEALTDFAAHLLASAGLGPEEVTTLARSLVGANLRGYDSHGVMRIPQYLEQIAQGEITPGAPLEVLRETSSLLTADGHWGFGQVQAGRLLERLIEKAEAGGVGVGTMIRCAHTGRLGQYCEEAAEAGLVAMVMVNNHGGVMRVAPPGGKAPRLSTNPIAVGIPRGDEPIVMDFCTCMAAEGKVRVKRIAGELCPDGWLLDHEGRPTNDPNDLYDDPPGTILPVGGTQPYKGFALGLMVEILSGALSGGVCARPVPVNQIGNCVFMMVLSPAHFGGSDHFAAEVSHLAEFIRGCPRIDGVDEILLPGDPERRTLARKSAEGITLDEGNFAKLAALARQRGVALPESAEPA